MPFPLCRSVVCSLGDNRENDIAPAIGRDWVAAYVAPPVRERCRAVWQAPDVDAMVSDIRRRARSEHPADIESKERSPSSWLTLPPVGRHGRPRVATITALLLAYLTAFQYWRLSYASSMGFFLVLMIRALTSIRALVARKPAFYQ